MELDVWIPKHKIALEYEGEQHYHELQNIFGATNSSVLYSARDRLKKEACDQAGISLVCIPYWWDRKQSTLLNLLEEENVHLQFE